MKTILRFRIELEDITPPIWRRIEVPAEGTFWDLHVAIQNAMGWQDKHLHVFSIQDAKGGVTEIGVPDPHGASTTVAGWQRTLDRHFRKPGDQALYEYDFGDAWLHTVLLEALSLAEPGVTCPRCVGGARACPPEDCGGVPAYEELVGGAGGGAFDPEAFDAAQVKFADPRDRLKKLTGEPRTH